jgi:hypothetical protein
MSNPKQPERDIDVLDLAAETVRDLDPKPADADAIRGRNCRAADYTVVQTNERGET